MTRKLVQHGNSAALILDKPILELLNVYPLMMAVARGEKGKAEIAHALRELSKPRRNTSRNAP